MKAGDKERINGVMSVWTVCPSCGFGRWAALSTTHRVMYTGRCITCYREVARREMHRYWPRNPNSSDDD